MSETITPEPPLKGIARQSQLWCNTKEEIAIRKAIDAVEKMGADERLTNTINCLEAALDELGPYVDEKLGPQDYVGQKGADEYLSEI